MIKIGLKPRGIWIAGNWKMNFGPKETQDFFSDLRTAIQLHWDLKDSEFLHQGQLRACLIPPVICLQQALLEAQNLPFPLEIIAQNAHWETQGAFTGEISGPMLKEIGIPGVLIGHSERRQFFGETNASARLRVESLLKQGFHVILCIGETRIERDHGKTQEILSQQIQEILSEIKFSQGRFILAYEPIWAIGTGLTATPTQTNEAHQQIRKALEDLRQPQATNTPILYGGSVTPQNAKALLSCSEVDGLLFGGASLKAESFLAVLKSALQLKS